LVKSFRGFGHGESATIASWNSAELKAGSDQSMLSPPNDMLRPSIAV
jgi:hypothetical protein